MCIKLLPFIIILRNNSCDSIKGIKKPIPKTLANPINF